VLFCLQKNLSGSFQSTQFAGVKRQSGTRIQDGSAGTVVPMSNAFESVDVVVAEDGSVHLPAGFEARPGEHLKLVRYEEEAPKKRKSARGIGVGKVSPEEILTWEDFEAAHQANVESAARKYGPLES
jgi:hypothetical protein